MVISDTGPLLAFANTDLLCVLERLFTRVHVPQAVHDECHGRQGRDTARIDHAVEQGWLAVLPTRSDEPLAEANRTRREALGILRHVRACPADAWRDGWDCAQSA